MQFSIPAILRKLPKDGILGGIASHINCAENPLFRDG